MNSNKTAVFTASFLVFLLIFVFMCRFSFADCSECKRAGVMGQCENLALPGDYDDTFDDYNDCLEQQYDRLCGGFSGLLTPEDAWNFREQAEKLCKNLEPDYDREFCPLDGEAMAVNLGNYINMTMMCDRFHMQSNQGDLYREKAGREGWGDLPKKDKSRPPAYFFEAAYDCARTPATSPDGYDQYPSSLNIRMYYDGEKKEKVKEWTAKSTIHTWRSLINRMFLNSSAQMRQDRPITNIIDAFEKVPVKCDIRPQYKKISFRKKMKITLAGFTDATGDRSREFNRVAVMVLAGKITNGEQPEGAKYHKIAVFQVGDNSVEIDYQAPDTSFRLEETIRIYHCHDIQKKSVLPLSKTDVSKNVIAEKKVPFKYPGVSANISVQIRQSENSSSKSFSGVSRRDTWQSNTLGTVFIRFQKKPRVDKDFDVKKQQFIVKRYHYAVKDIRLVSATFSGNGSHSENSRSRGINTSTTASGKYSGAKLSEAGGNEIVMDVDPKTGRITRVYLPGIEARGTIQYRQTGTKYEDDKTESIDDLFKTGDTIGFQQIPDDGGPDRCYEVQEGDHKSIFKGGSRYTTKTKNTTSTSNVSWTVMIN